MNALDVYDSTDAMLRELKAAKAMAANVTRRIDRQIKAAESLQAKAEAAIEKETKTK